MNNFFFIIQRTVAGVFLLCFAFVTVYVPQSWNNIEHAEAGGGGSICVGPCLSEATFAMRDALQYAETVAIAGYTSITSLATNNLWIKEYALDGIAWMLAKQIISQMTTSIVNWINSGFQGSPAFVQDLNGFLTKVADNAVGQYLNELGGPFSFICSPFQYDIRVALAVNYAAASEGRPVDSCTLTGALSNLENFLAGDFSSGGWDAWFDITSQPHIYTPYGSFLEAESQASARILNARSEQSKLLEFGQGFLSSKICNTVVTAGVPKENCVISTPGKVIEEALTFQLSTGQRSLIASDEIDEVIGALIGQLAKQAITGAAGLLGLSGGTGYTDTSFSGYSGVSYLDELSTEIIADNYNANSASSSVPVTTTQNCPPTTGNLVINPTQKTGLGTGRTFDEVFDAPGNGYDSFLNDSSEIQALPFTSNFTAGRINWVPGNQGGYGYTDRSISKCPGDFSMPVGGCYEPKSSNYGSFSYDTNPTKNYECQVEKGVTYYLNIRASAGEPASGFVLQNVVKVP